MRIALLSLALVACAGDDPPALLDTGWFTSTTDLDPESCPNRFLSQEPDGSVPWYWRDRPQLLANTAVPEAYDAWIETPDGVRLPTEKVWDETGLRLTLEWDGALAPNTTYTLGSTDCAGLHEVAFTTSAFGEPLTVGLQGRTYLLDLVGANWVEPPELGSLFGLFFNAPILLGVSSVQNGKIDVLAAQGAVSSDGVVSQDDSQASWDFPISDFSDSPYLRVSAPEVVFAFIDGGDTLDVPVTGFEITGTFSADGTELGGGTLAGLADTRNLGAAVQDPGNPEALCAVADGLGLDCGPCPDALPYCLQLRIEDLEGVWQPDLSLVDTNG